MSLVKTIKRSELARHSYVPPEGSRGYSLRKASGDDADFEWAPGQWYDQTDEEIEAEATPVDFSIPSHSDSGVVIPQRFFQSASLTASQMHEALSTAWDVAQASGCHIYAPTGVYDVGEFNLPFRQDGTPTSLLDCQNITIFGDGPSTIFRTTSVAGADVFQLNGLKNFHLRNLMIQSSVSGNESGANGISVTNGFDNITILDVWIENLGSLDAGDHVDGGKGLTVQSTAIPAECGTLKARIFVKGCAEGFGFEVDLNTADDKKTSVDVDLVAEDCFYAVKMGAGAATAALSSSFHQGVRVRGQAINCQKDVVLNRAHGCDIDLQVITTKTEAARRLNPSGVTWYAADTIVESLLCIYAHRSQINVTGNKGACAYKARIGGTTAGSSGLIGATDDCDIFLDIGGTAGTADVQDVDSGGNTLRNSRIYASVATASTLPTAFYAASLNNTLTIGPSGRYVSPKFASNVLFAFGSDGTTESGRIALFGAITGLQGKATSTPSAPVAGLYDQSGTIQWGIVNSGGVVIPSVGTGAALGAYVGKHPIYDGSGALLGYFPIYA